MLLGYDVYRSNMSIMVLEIIQDINIIIYALLKKHLRAGMFFRFILIFGI